MVGSNGVSIDEDLGRLWARYALNLGKISNLHKWYKLAAEHTKDPSFNRSACSLKLMPLRTTQSVLSLLQLFKPLDTYRITPCFFLMQQL
jgi:hypothetical protein